MGNVSARSKFLRRTCALCCALALAAAAVCGAAAMASPSEAYAKEEVFHLTQKYFSSGSCYITVDTARKKGYFVLDEDITGCLGIVTSVELNLDLNGHTITCPADSSKNMAAIQVREDGSESGCTVNITNGTVVQQRSDLPAITVDQDNANVTLTNLTVSAAGEECLFQSSFDGCTTICGGSYTAVPSGGSYQTNVLYAREGGITVDEQYPATFTLDGDGDVVARDAKYGALTLKGGSYNKCPSKATLPSGYAVFKSNAEGSTWNVVTEDAARISSHGTGELAGWSVTVDGFGTAYFDSADEARSFATEQGSTAATVAAARVGVTYYANVADAAAAGGDVEILLGAELKSSTEAADYLKSNRSLQYKDGHFCVVDAADDDAADALKNVSGWILTTATGGKVYYGTTDADKAQAASDAAAMSGSTLTTVCHVTFKDYQGNDVETRVLLEGEELGALPAEGTRADYEFLGWCNGDTKAEASTKPTESATYTATWKILGTAKIGSIYYDTLQAAIDAATAGDTVLLMEDATETVSVDKGDVGEFTIDLNGKTLTGANEKLAICIHGSSKVVVMNGNIISEGACIDFVVPVSGAEVTLRDGENGLSLNTTGDYGLDAITMREGKNCTVNVEGGSYVSTCHALRSTQTGNAVNISGGNFTSGSDDIPAVWVIFKATANVSGGWFSNHIWCGNSTSVTLTGGSFGNDKDKGYVSSGYLMEGPDDGGRYTVVKDTVDPVLSLGAGTVFEGSANFTVSDDNKVLVMVGGTELKADENGTYTLSEATLGNIQEGKLTIKATDVNGNATTADVYWYEDHEWGDWADSQDGTFRTRTCLRCGKVETEETGHKANANKTSDDKALPQTGDPVTVVSGIAAAGAALAGFGAYRRRK